MMYVKWWFEYTFSDVKDVFNFFGDLGDTIDNCVDSLFALIGAFPAWLVVPFTALISIAVLFRLSQFVPTIGGAS